MSERLPRINAAELLRTLRRDGWQIVRHSGSHAALKHSDKKGRVPVPIHAGVILKPKTLSAIMDQAELTADELRKLL